MYTMNAKEYDEKVMNGYFKKIYPVIASQIVEKTQIVQGTAIDLGGGPGMLGISLAQQTDLQVIVYDLMEECVQLVPKNSRENGVPNRVTAIQGRAENMLFEDASVELVVSRGSIFFWEDQEKGLREVYRILKPGGWAYIGGGFGTAELLHEVQKKRKEEHDGDWEKKRDERMKKNPPGHFESLLKNLSIEGTVERGEAGTWIIFQKPTV
jgi:ubiquinone/menaquinone biosynthesis C-methylase UbiE